MSLTASNIIESARNQHPLFDPRLCPTKAALDRLSNEQRALVRRISQVHPEVLETIKELTAVPFSLTGITLDEAIWREGRTVVFSDGTTDFWFVDSTDAGNPDLWPSGYLSGTKLFLNGDTEAWSKATKITYAHVLIPAALTAVANSLSVPDEAEAYLVADLALWMARRVQGRSGAPGVGTFDAERREALSDLLVTIANRKTGQVYSITSLDD